MTSGMSRLMTMSGNFSLKRPMSAGRTYSPAVVTAVTMPLTYSIATGIGLAVCKRIAEAQGGRQVVGRVPRLELVEEPEPLLGEGEGEASIPGDRLEGRRVTSVDMTVGALRQVVPNLVAILGAEVKVPTARYRPPRRSVPR